MNKIFILLFIALVCNVVVDATHFRYGAIKWEPVSVSSYNTIKFTIDLAFRKTYFSSVTVGGTINHSTFYYGDGGSATVSMIVSSVNTDEDWFTGTFTTQYTYKNNGNYTAYYSDCCRISTLENNRDTNWYISTSVLVKTAANQGGVLNTSPVVGGSPIVQVTALVENKYTIVAVDAENQALTYSLSTIWGSSLVHPTGLTLSGNVITFTPGAVDTGKDYELYCTQIVVSDGISYTVVDFIFKAVRPISGVCDPSCSNDATQCSTSSTCKNCNSTLNGNTCLPKQPPYFVTPTPDANSITTFTINKQDTYTIKAVSPYKSLTVAVSPANPKGSAISTINNANPASVTYSWTPAVSDAGSFVVSASIQDSQGTAATEGARSFVLFVTKPTCGNGVETNGVCVCNSGWNATSNCFNCENGYYGPECDPSQNCNGNGQSNDGVSGDGTCRCYLGYTGVNCEIKVAQFCNSSSQSYVSDSSTTTGFLQPSALTAVISTYSTVSALTLPIKLAKPSVNPITNILTVFDLNVYSTSLLSSYKTEASGLDTGVTSLNEASQFAFGTFSDATSGNYNYQSKYIMGTSAESAIKTILKDATTSTSTNGNSLLALNSAAQSSVAWQSGAFRIVLIITDADYTVGSNTTLVETETVSKLIENSIYPVIVSTNGNLPNWVAFLNKTGNFGVVKVSTGGSDWRKKAIEGIQYSYSYVIPKVVEDLGGFVSSIPAVFQAPTATTYNLNYALKFPTSTPPTRPTVTLSVIGWGKVTIVINYNHPPVAQPYQLGLDEDTNKNFTLVVTDIDSNLIKIAFTNITGFASKGSVYFNGNQVVVNTFNDISIVNYFTFVPVSNAFGSFVIPFTASDGCSESSSTISVTINEINDPTTCSNIAGKTVNVSTPATFTLSGTDVDDSVIVTLSTFTELAAAGTLKVNGVAAVAGTQYASGLQFTYTQTDNSISAIKTLYFTVSDGRGSSMTCSIPITLTHVNMAPSVTSATPVSGVPTIETQVNLQITDVDSTGGVVTFSQLSTTDSAKFYLCSTPSTILSVSSSLSYTLTKQQTVISICVKSTIQVATSNYATVTFKANDMEVDSNTFTVIVNLIGSRPNSPPVVTQIPNFSFTQGSPAPSVSITGTDPNQPEFDNTLIAVITQQPVNGKFVLTSNLTQTAPSSSVSPFAITYVPNADFFGIDSFSYTLSDELGARDTPKTTTITVVYKNYPPVLNIAPYVFNQNTPTNAQSLSVSDVDIIKVQDVVKCSITTLPTKFTMKQSSGVVISSTPTLLVDQSTYTYFITVAPNTYTSLTDTFNATCVDSFGNSDSAQGTITFNYINVPPTAADSVVQTDQNVPKQFTFSVGDLEDPSNVKVKLLSTPTNGKIVCNSVVATVGSIIPSTCIYTPTEGLSDWNTLGHLGPLDTISFVSVDTASAQSLTTASVKFNVKPMNPPVFEGNTHYTTLEDNSIPVIINGKPGDGGSTYNARITNIQGNGTFSISHCMGNEGCMNVPITELPAKSEGSSLYNYYFTPAANENGNSYMVITFVLYETTPDYELTSKDLTITIDVIPVNDPPTITLIESQIIGGNPVPMSQDGPVVSISMDNTVILTYTGNDIDSDNDLLQSQILAPPGRGSLYVYNETATDFLGPLITRNISTRIIARTGANWKLVFVPVKGASGTGYAKIPIAIKDFEQSLSSSKTITIDVDPVNVPPFITANKTQYTVQVGSNVSITEVTFDDPDSTYNDVLLIITVLKDDGKTIVTDAVPVLSGKYNKICTQKSGVTKCQGNKALLNSFLTTISLNQTSGSYILRIFVDDLGYNAAPLKRSSSHLTATKDLAIEVTPLDAGTKKTSNKTVLSAAIAGAAVAAGVIAAGVWKLVKRSAPPTNAFFGDNPFADGAITSNPLYAESANSGVNPLYEAENDA